MALLFSELYLISLLKLCLLIECFPFNQEIEKKVLLLEMVDYTYVEVHWIAQWILFNEKCIFTLTICLIIIYIVWGFFTAPFLKTTYWQDQFIMININYFQ